MRILFTCYPGFGHLHPMLPLARAAQRAGHHEADEALAAITDGTRPGGPPPR